MEVNLQKVLVRKGDTTSYNNTKDLNKNWLFFYKKYLFRNQSESHIIIPKTKFIILAQLIRKNHGQNTHIYYQNNFH